MSKEARTSKGVSLRLEMSEKMVVIRVGKIIVFGAITNDHKSWIEGILSTTTSLEDTINKISRAKKIRWSALMA